jgi:dihydrofolate reductase
MHTSLDGFAATTGREINWIKLDDEIFDYAGHQTKEADTALYGKETYKIMQDYWPTAADKPNASKHDIEHSTWYNSVEKIILSTTLRPAEIKNAKIISDNVVVEINQLKAKPGKNIVMFGSPGATRSLAQENLVDEFWIFVNPVILGNGIPYLQGIKNSLKLKLISSKAFPSGVVCVHYQKA